MSFCSLDTPVRVRFPFTLKYVKKMIDDLAPSLIFMLNPRKQHRALKEVELCQSIPDYIAFSQRWLGGGAMQIPAEIEAALNYIGTDAPRLICEIGTAHGGTTFLFSRALHSAELIIGVDIYVKNRAQLNLLRRVGQDIRLVNGSSYAFATIRRIESILNQRRLMFCSLMVITGMKG